MAFSIRSTASRKRYTDSGFGGVDEVKEKYSGQITVFLSLVLIFVCGLLCGLLESARTAAARCYIEMAARSAADSLFSQYHRALWEEYRIFGLEHRSEEELTEEFAQFFQAYEEQENWYPIVLEDCSLTEKQRLTDAAGTYFLQEIVDYMKYGIWTKAWSESSAEESIRALTEAGQTAELSRYMEIQTKSAWKLEESLEKISACLAGQAGHRTEAERQLRAEDGDGFCEAAEELMDELKRVPGLVEEYGKQADAFGEELDALWREHEERKEELSESVWQAFAQELEEYRSYTDKDGERRTQIEALSPASKDRLSLTESVCEEAREVMEYIAQRETDDEDDEQDESELWRPVQRHFGAYVLLQFPAEAGIQDKEKEGLLNRLREMADQGILALVLPEDRQISPGLLAVENGPSRRESFEEEELDGGLLKKALTAEYCQVFLAHFCDTREKEPAYEMEYVLIGEAIDETNLARTAERLLLVREGMNLIHIMGDAEKRSQARNLAASIVGASGMLPLVTITAFLIMALWAFGEAAVDVRTLLSGGKVALVKTKADWRLSLEALLELASSGKLPDTEEGETGLSYPQYLTILLMTAPHTQLLFRTMDVIEMNLAADQPGFSLSDCAYQVDILASGSGKHVYFSVGLWKSLMGETENVYPFQISVSRAY